MPLLQTSPPFASEDDGSGNACGDLLSALTVWDILLPAGAPGSLQEALYRPRALCLEHRGLCSGTEVHFQGVFLHGMARCWAVWLRGGGRQHCGRGASAQHQAPSASAQEPPNVVLPTWALKSPGSVLTQGPCRAADASVVRHAAFLHLYRFLGGFTCWRLAHCLQPGASLPPALCCAVFCRWHKFSVA